mmetsp:Transcript_56485/g.165143  ORF Transcript_56485/g.165143 Transcript_56485/m.165143 type:complete len:421 (-) Transcript_56485:426-1688(-)
MLHALQKHDLVLQGLRKHPVLLQHALQGIPRLRPAVLHHPDGAEGADAYEPDVLEAPQLHGRVLELDLVGEELPHGVRKDVGEGVLVDAPQARHLTADLGRRAAHLVQEEGALAEAGVRAQRLHGQAVSDDLDLATLDDEERAANVPLQDDLCPLAVLSERHLLNQQVHLLLTEIPKNLHVICDHLLSQRITRCLVLVQLEEAQGGEDRGEALLGDARDARALGPCDQLLIPRGAEHLVRGARDVALQLRQGLVLHGLPALDGDGLVPDCPRYRALDDDDQLQASRRPCARLVVRYVHGLLKLVQLGHGEVGEQGHLPQDGHDEGPLQAGQEVLAQRVLQLLHAAEADELAGALCDHRGTRSGVVEQRPLAEGVPGPHGGDLLAVGKDGDFALLHDVHRRGRVALGDDRGAPVEGPDRQG